MTDLTLSGDVIRQDVRLADLQSHPSNYNRHSDAQIARIAKSLQTFGQVRSIVTWRNTILAGHGVVLAARSLGWQTLRADVVDGLSETEALAYVVADNELARQSDPDQEQLAAILQELNTFDTNLVEAAGYGQQELEQLLRLVGSGPVVDDPGPQVDRAEELRVKWDVHDGDVWQMDAHFIICGDCREPATWQRLLDAAGVEAVNGMFTSPPYAEQRKEQYGGVPVDEYVDWWEAVQDNVRAHLASDGSFFVNIKPHCEDGQRVLYVMDLVCAMVRRWEWRYNDEWCWIHGGIPGEVHTKLKNQFEPIHQFFLNESLKARLDSVRHRSDAVPQGGGGNIASQTGTGKAGKDYEVASGLAYPGNVLSIGKSREAMGHAAAFPVALPDFFIRAYSDRGDVWCDPFLGSGTTIMAAHQNGRRGLGIERLEKYVAVALERFATATGLLPTRLEGG